MIFSIPIKKHIEISPFDTLISPMGNHYQVVRYLDNQMLKLNPLDVEDDGGVNMEFSIVKDSLIEGGWKKIVI